MATELKSTPADSTQPQSNRDWGRQTWQRLAWQGAMIPERHGGLVFASGSAAVDRRSGAMDGAIASCREFSRWPWKEGLYLCGAVGCGKSMLAALTIRGMILSAQEVGWPVIDGARSTWDAFARSAGGHLEFWYPTFRFVNAPRLLQEIRNTFGRMSAQEITTESVLSEYLHVDVLVLDDLGSEKPTDWVREQLFMLIDERYGAKRPTIFTSNLSLKELALTLSERIADRILEMCRGRIVKIKCGSYR